MKSKERLYLTVDRTKVVKEGDPAAAFLLIGANKEIPNDMAKKYGLTDEEPKAAKVDIAAPEAVVDPEDEEKAVESADNKAVTQAPANKAEGRTRGRG